NDECLNIISGLDEGSLSKSYVIQGSSMSGIAAVVHVTEHYSYHTGQIVYLTKSLKDTDTGFYKGANLNAKNK
ncbi:MAG TPA: DUF1572 family protein, partial [Ignavibacteria bacterium]|nr:DUF1572 family protein [Ignavibacteria bacterium]